MKTYSSDALQSKHTFESLYISPGLNVLHQAQGINRKENKLSKNDVSYMKNNQSMPYFFLASRC